MNDFGTSKSDASKSDISNPYFTHHSDHPGLVLISKPLNEDNYSAWHRAMTLALNAKNKLGFLNGTIKAPSEETHTDDYATWSRCNDMVHSWIVNKEYKRKTVIQENRYAQNTSSINGRFSMLIS